MIINEIRDINDRYKVVYFDNGFFFKAKNWEISRLKLAVDMDVQGDLYDKLYKEFGIRRCRYKAVDILSRADNSQTQIRRKLSDAYFAPQVIDEVIHELISRKYIDDERFASSYILGNSSNKSKFQIRQKLYEKGVDSVLADRLLDDLYEDRNEENIITKQLKRYADFDGNISKEKIDKILMSFYRKGIYQNEVMKIIERDFNII